MANLIFNFLANDRGLKKGIANSRKQLSGFEKSTKKVSAGISKALGGFGVALGATAIIGQLKGMAEGVEKAQIASKKLANVLDSMGYQKSTARVDAYAESLERSLSIDADVIKSTQTKLATFNELAKTSDEAGGAFDRATVAALDLAAAGFGTAESNAVQLGKALNDPVKGLSSLTRSGVTFTKQEKQKIRVLVETNKTLEAQDLILAAIEKQVGGTAKESVSSFERMRLATERIRDSIGEKVLPIVEKLADYIVDVVAPAVEQFIADVSNPDSDAGKIFVRLKDLAKGLWDQIVQIASSDAFKKNLERVLTVAEKLLQVMEGIANTGDISVKVVAGPDAAKMAMSMSTSARQLFAMGLAQEAGWKDFDYKDGFAAANDLVGGADGKVNTPWPMAKGGIVLPRPGGTLARIGEAGRPEAVIPLNKSGNMLGGNTYVININKANVTGQEIVAAIQRFERGTGRKMLLNG
jgi:ribosomal protein L12E/L44/L45/RPP1/RPP2